MKTKLSILLLVLLGTLGFSACSDSDDDSVAQTLFTLTIDQPTNLADLKTTTWTITFKERNTGQEYKGTTETNELKITLPQGDYQITGENPSTYTLQGSTISTTLLFTDQSVVVTGETKTSTSTSFPKTVLSGTFVIEEMFYTGTQTPEGKQFLGDQYVKLYNNTDQTLYADGLFLATTKRVTSNTYTYNPEIINEAVFVSNIILVPGDGKTYPVAPGKSFIITASAVDHTKGNANSFDLQKADMEWYNEGKPNQPANNPDVPNTTSVYGTFSLHTNGLSNLIMGRLQTSVDDYLKNYTHECDWTWIFNGKDLSGTLSGYKIPNEWVIDAVYTSVEGSADTRALSPTLDLVWTYCGSSSGDVNRYGKSVIRKIESTVDGRNILKDTNNSSVDFTPNSKPSLSK